MGSLGKGDFAAFCAGEAGSVVGNNVMSNAAIRFNAASNQAAALLPPAATAEAADAFRWAARGWDRRCFDDYGAGNDGKDDGGDDRYCSEAGDSEAKAAGLWSASSPSELEAPAEVEVSPSELATGLLRVLATAAAAASKTAALATAAATAAAAGRGGGSGFAFGGGGGGRGSDAGSDGNDGNDGSDEGGRLDSALEVSSRNLIEALGAIVTHEVGDFERCIDVPIGEAWTATLCHVNMIVLRPFFHSGMPSPF